MMILSQKGFKIKMISQANKVTKTRNDLHLLENIVIGLYTLSSTIAAHHLRDTVLQHGVQNIG
jgi:hypothetical protein